jgi:hypothetical protein
LEDTTPRSTPTDSEVGNFERDIDELEESLLALRNEDLIFIQGKHNVNMELVYLNEATYSAATNLFYTQLRDLPWTARFIRRQVKFVHEIRHVITRT